MSKHGLWSSTVPSIQKYSPLLQMLIFGVGGMREGSMNIALLRERRKSPHVRTQFDVGTVGSHFSDKLLLVGLRQVRGQ
jgi:hypothetical protein